MTIKTFFKECHKREVFKKLSLYVVFSWIVIQVLAAIWDPLGLPKESVTVLIVLLLIGLPLYAFYIGRYEIKELKEASLEDGIETEEELKTIRVVKKFFFAGVTLIGILVGIAVFFIITNSFDSKPRQIVVSISDKIAVLSFDNNTGQEKYDVVSEMAADWIIQGITENKIGQVVSPGIIDSYKSSIDNALSIDGDSNVLKNVIKPKTIISGNFYLQGNELLFKGSVLDGVSDEIMMSFDTISCDESDPLLCVENLQQVILGYFGTKDNEALNLQQKPPKFSAYQDVLLAKEVFGSDNDEYLRLLNNAIAVDPEYFEPKVLRIGHYYNLGAYEVADSLLQNITFSRNNNRQRNLLKTYAALMQGENGQIYRYVLEEYKLAPFDLLSNSTAMVIAQQFVNKPEDVDSLYRQINMDKMDIDNCGSCQSRLLIKAQSHISLGQYQEVINLPYEKKFYEDPYIIALVRLGKLTELNAYLSLKEARATKTQVDKATFLAAKQLLILGSENTEPFLRSLLRGEGDVIKKIDAAIWLEEFSLAKKEALVALKLYPEKIQVTFQLALIAQKLGDKKFAHEMLERLEGLRKPYQYGSVDYAFAQYYASIGEEELMNEFLLKAVASGAFFTLQNFQNDPYFMNYSETEAFKHTMSFWH